MNSTGIDKRTNRPYRCFSASTALINQNPKSSRPQENYKEITQYLNDHPQIIDKYPFLFDLLEVEQAYNKLCDPTASLPAPRSAIIVNPCLELVSVQYSDLPLLFKDISSRPIADPNFVLLYRKSDNDPPTVRDATAHDLLALKIIVEKLDYQQVAQETGVTLGKIDSIVYRGIQEGILLSPPSRIKRGKRFSKKRLTDSTLFSSPVFTLQWHITQKCDLHCLHCYDRSERDSMTLKQGIKVLDDLYDFCREQFVYGQVTFTGGNPFLHPNFFQLYQEAADRGFLLGILGNPVPREKIDATVRIRKPQFYQVSLEGMQHHTDYIRGAGHFDRTIKFLQILHDAGIYSMVMLTLTNENVDQVLELAEFLKGKVDRFNFNRLSMVGEGASLASVDISSYSEFLKRYMVAAANNPIMGLKDNLFNLIQKQTDQNVFFGGCAGYGCGAAFNFVSLLPDGRVDACRKFDSPMGNIFNQSLSEIYNGELGHRYRNGPSKCEECDIRAVCRGCMAVSYGMGKDVFTELDPYCFI